MRLFFFGFFSLFIVINLNAQIITIGNTGDFPNLNAAANAITAGDTLLFQSQVFSGGTQTLIEAHGTENKPIVLLSEQEHGAVFRGGTVAIHLIKCSYVEINGFIIEQQMLGGVNIDDGGDFNSPSKHVTVRNSIFRDVAANGNHDLLKMSGIDSFLIENCEFLNGSDLGEGVDFVGCHWGTVQDNYFDNAGLSGIQNKGGTQFIRIQRNLFRNMFSRAVNLGGGTGLQFFRPPLPDPIVDAFEAADLEVFSNVFIDCYAPVAYASSVRVNVSNNTIYHPIKWVFRILQDNADPGFLLCGDNEFKNNIIYLQSDLTEVNIGPNTDPGSFLLNNNLWYNESSSSWTPGLPVTDSNHIIANPLFIDASGEDFHLDPMSPAIEAGITQLAVQTDYDLQAYHNPPSIGAFEGYDSTTQAQIEIVNQSIRIYPNPATNSVKLEGDFFDSSLYIVDANGRVVENISNVNSPYTIQLKSLPAGLYFIQIINNQHSKLFVRKIIKK